MGNRFQKCEVRYIVWGDWYPGDIVDRGVNLDFRNQNTVKILENQGISRKIERKSLSGVLLESELQQVEQKSRVITRSREIWNMKKPGTQILFVIFAKLDI